jgi:hypothetical protein
MMDGHPKITKGSSDTDNAHKKVYRKKKKLLQKLCQSNGWQTPECIKINRHLK